MIESFDLAGKAPLTRKVKEGRLCRLSNGSNCHQIMQNYEVALMLILKYTACCRITRVYLVDQFFWWAIPAIRLGYTFPRITLTLTFTFTFHLL